MHLFWSMASILGKTVAKNAPNHILDEIRWLGQTDIVSPCVSRPKLRSIEPDASAAPAPNRHKFVILGSNQLQVI
jgi:hypothetical protein